MILNKKNLNIYAENGFNVILSGRHGVGKTEIIKSIFNAKFDDKWAYFSAATMDAWVDFVGVPKAVKREDGTEVLELIRPARFADDDVEAIFFDEFNRAPPKVINAVMELIQFKSINGRKFENLKVVWAAINPHDEEGTYDVDEIDPAQLDRFQIQIEMPYRLDKIYFKKEHGEKSTPFIEWWTALTKDLQYKVSPRRLDDGIRVHSVGGDLKDVFPKDSNVKDLLARISRNSLRTEWILMLKEGIEYRKKFLNNVSNIEKFNVIIIKNFKRYGRFLPHDYLMTQITLNNAEWVRAILKNIKFLDSTIKKEIEITINKKKKLPISDMKEKPALFGKRVYIKCDLSPETIEELDNKDSVKNLLRAHGARIVTELSTLTDLLIVDKITLGTEHEKYAIRNDVKIIDKKEFINWLTENV